MICFPNGAINCCTIKRVPLRYVFCMRLSPCASGAGRQGRVMLLGNIQSTLPAGHPLFLPSPNGAPRLSERAGLDEFLGSFHCLGLITWSIDGTDLFDGDAGVFASPLIIGNCHYISLIGHVMSPLLGFFFFFCDKGDFLLAL